MPQLNRREFLYSGVVASAAAAIAPQILASPPERAWQPVNSVSQDARTETTVLPQFGEDSNFVNWRQQGLSLSERAMHYRYSLR